MAFPNGTTTYYIPSSGNAGSSLWGTNVKQVLSSADATQDTSTLTNHGTSSGSQQNRTIIPYTNNNTDTTDSEYGWAVTSTDMGASSSTIRKIPSGDHVAHWRAQSTNGADGSAWTLTMYVYKVASATNSRTRTLIASGTKTGNFVSGDIADISISVSVPEVLFNDDETIQWSFEFASPGAALLGKSVGHYMGTSTTGSTQARIVTPALKSIILGTGSSIGACTVTGVGAKRFSGIGSASGLAVVSGIGSSIRSSAGTSSGLSTVLGIGASYFSSIYSSSGISSVVGYTTGIGTPVGSAVGSSFAEGFSTLYSVGVGEALGTATVTGYLSALSTGLGSAEGLASVDGIGASMAQAIFEAVGTSTAYGETGKLASGVGTCIIGEQVIRTFLLFDD